MSRVDRRAFLLGAGGLAGSVSLGGPFGRPALAQAKPKVVVIGGGPGGATVAKYIAKDSAGAIEVTLVEPAREFTTCFFSNLYLGGLRSWESITHRYDALASKYKVTMAHQMASAIDRDRKIVRLADGTEL